MPSPPWENLQVFLNVDEFATTARVGDTVSAPGVGDGVELVGIFDDPYLSEVTGEYERDTSDPRLTCRESDAVAAGIERGTYIAIGDRVFRSVSFPQPDGTGMALVVMRESDL